VGQIAQQRVDPHPAVVSRVLAGQYPPVGQHRHQGQFPALINLSWREPGARRGHQILRNAAKQRPLYHQAIGLERGFHFVGQPDEGGVFGRLIQPQPDLALIGRSLETDVQHTPASRRGGDRRRQVELAGGLFGDKPPDTPNQGFLLPGIEQLRTRQRRRLRKHARRSLAERCDRRLRQPGTPTLIQPQSAGSHQCQSAETEGKPAGPGRWRRHDR